MFDIFGTIAGEGVDIKVYLICTLCAFLCGIISAVCAGVKTTVSKSFVISLVLLPPIVETVILMVNGNVGTGIAVAGAFSLVRFRSVPGKAREIAAIFMAMTAGLTCAAGYVGIAVLFCLLVGGAMAVLNLLPMGADRESDLRITIPENLNFSEVFDDILEKYTNEYRLLEVKTTGMGSLYKLTYKITLKDAGAQKEFIDELRVRNGNLEIALCRSAGGNEEL